MKPFAILAITVLFSATLPGCGGAPEEGDTSHLSSPEAHAFGDKAAAMYEGGGKSGPAAAKAGLDGGNTEETSAE